MLHLVMREENAAARLRRARAGRTTTEGALDMRVAIAGAGAVGRSIARELIDNGHQVLLIDKSPSAIRPERVPNAEWLLADSCELSSLEEAQLDKCDVVIAATGDDKANLVTSLLAKTEFGVPRTVGRVNHPNNEWLFTEAWGVDVNVSTPRIMSALVEEAVTHRRPRAAVHVPPGQRQPGRADAARRLAVRRHARPAWCRSPTTARW